MDLMSSWWWPLQMMNMLCKHEVQGHLKVCDKLVKLWYVCLYPVYHNITNLRHHKHVTSQTLFRCLSVMKVWEHSSLFVQFQDASGVIYMQHTIVNAAFALFATSCAICPCFFHFQPATSPGILGPAKAASHKTDILLTNQNPEDVNNTRSSCRQELQWASAYPSKLKWYSVINLVRI